MSMSLPLLTQLARHGRRLSDVYAYAPEVGAILRGASPIAWDAYRKAFPDKNIPTQADNYAFMSWLEDIDKNGRWMQLAAPTLNRNPIMLAELENTITWIRSGQVWQKPETANPVVYEVDGLPLYLPPECAQHATNPTDSDVRLSWAKEALPGAVLMESDPAQDEDIERVHPHEWWQSVKSWSLTGGGMLDAETIVDPGSISAIYAASGAMISATEKALREKSPLQVCAIRPGSHHASPEKAMGSCVVNHLAIAAKWTQSRGVARVAIVDWDAHHGNGTEECFRNDGSVMTVSVHQHPHYPGTGGSENQGTEHVKGSVLNLPLPAGADGSAFELAWERTLDALRAFNPQMVFLEASFDAHVRDPASQLSLEDVDFASASADLMRACMKMAAPLIIEVGGGLDRTAFVGSLNATAVAAQRILNQS